jgi:hypothetical protein
VRYGLGGVIQHAAFTSFELKSASNIDNYINLKQQMVNIQR